MVKSFNVPMDYVLYEMSYANMQLYSASLPTYKKPKTGDAKPGEKQEIINAGDPKNKDRVREFLDAIE